MSDLSDLNEVLVEMGENPTSYMECDLAGIELDVKTIDVKVLDDGGIDVEITVGDPIFSEQLNAYDEASDELDG
jgi:hypothetical protein